MTEGYYRSDAFRTGFKHLAPMGLVFDAWLLEPLWLDLARVDRAGALGGDRDRPANPSRK